MYPITSAVRINDTEDRTLFVVVDRPYAGSSLEAGTIELIQNRRLFYDDGKGTGEDLDDHQWDDNQGEHTRSTYFVGLVNGNGTYEQRQL